MDKGRVLEVGQAGSLLTGLVTLVSPIFCINYVSRCSWVSYLGCVWEPCDIWAESKPSSFPPFSLRAHWVDRVGMGPHISRDLPVLRCGEAVRGLCSPSLEPAAECEAARGGDSC